jgi:hypothetical protein
MEDRIKTALERAMERADALGDATPEDLRRMDQVPVGNAIAAKYMRREVRDLQAELDRSDASDRAYVQEGIATTLVKNVTLPKDPRAKESALLALEGILALKGESTAVKEVVEQVQHILTYYEGAQQQTYFNFKQEFETRLPPEALRSMEMQLGPQWRSQLEKIPQFQDEWRRARTRLDDQYEQTLQEQKKALLA